MIRNRVLGVAMVAVLIGSGIAASSASAVGKLTSPGGYPQHLQSEDLVTEILFTVNGNEITCEESFTGTLAAATGEFELTPEYKNCKTKSTANNVTITLNGCTFVVKVLATVVTDKDEATIYVKCPVKPMELHHYSSEANHTAGTSSCTNTVQTQSSDKFNITSETEAGKTDIKFSGRIELSVLTHGACSFGFTVTQTMEYHLHSTVKTKSGARIHIG